MSILFYFILFYEVRDAYFDPKNGSIYLIELN